MTTSRVFEGGKRYNRRHDRPSHRPADRFTSLDVWLRAGLLYVVRARRQTLGLPETGRINYKYWLEQRYMQGTKSLRRRFLS